MQKGLKICNDDVACWREESGYNMHRWRYTQLHCGNDESVGRSFDLLAETVGGMGTREPRVLTVEAVDVVGHPGIRVVLEEDGEVSTRRSAQTPQVRFGLLETGEFAKLCGCARVVKVADQLVSVSLV